MFKELKDSMASLAWHHEFWATLLYSRLKVRVVTDIPTLAVSTDNLYVNKEYFIKLPDKSVRMSALAHEIAHAMFMHPAKMARYQKHGLFGEPFDMKRYNIAADLVINALLKRSKFKLSPTWLLSPQVTGSERVEDVYKGLTPPEDHNPQQGQGEPAEGGQGGQGAGEPGEGDPSDDGDSNWKFRPDGGYEEDITMSKSGMGSQDAHLPQEATIADEMEWKSAVKSAVAAAKARGNLPGFMKDAVKDIVEPKRPWREVLRDYIVPSRGFDMRDHRRFNNFKARQFGILFNKRKSECLDHAVVVVDCSGSVYHEFPIFMGAILEIFEQIRPKKLTIMNVDTRVTKKESFDDASEPANWEQTGGGGTDMEACYAELEDEHVDVCVILTDGYTAFREEPEFPVVWVSTELEESKYGYGQVVMMRD